MTPSVWTLGKDLETIGHGIWLVVPFLQVSVIAFTFIDRVYSVVIQLIYSMRNNKVDSLAESVKYQMIYVFSFFLIP